MGVAFEISVVIECLSKKLTFSVKQQKTKTGESEESSHVTLCIKSILGRGNSW